MGKKSRIPWTMHTFNPAWGCTQVSDGCANCYAKAQMERFGFDQFFGVTQPRRLFGDKHWNEPIKWNRDAERQGVPARVFCASMADWCENHPDIREQLPRLWSLIRRTPWLIWQLCTKRAEDIEVCLPPDWGTLGYQNVWLGVTVESMKYAERARVLSKIPAVVRWISNEPALGDISEMNLTDIDWIVYGGETGVDFRKDEPHWCANLLNRCWIENLHQELHSAVARTEPRNIAFFYKQCAGIRPGQVPPPGPMLALFEEDAERWPVREFPKPRPGYYSDETLELFPEVPVYVD